LQLTQILSKDILTFLDVLESIYYPVGLENTNEVSIFLTTRHREELYHSNLIVRLRQPNRHKIHQCVMEAMTLFIAEDWRDSLVVMRDFMQSMWQTGEMS
jgi:hypothetical protein